MKFSIRFLLLLILVVSIYFFVATLPPNKISKVRGIDIRQTQEDETKFFYTEHATKATVAHLVNLLKLGGRIDFYDREPTISDPGVYVTMKKVEQGFLFHFANSGWSSDWIPANEDEAIEYLWSCHEHNNGMNDEWYYPKNGVTFVPTGTISKTHRIDSDRESRFAIHIRSHGKNE